MGEVSDFTAGTFFTIIQRWWESLAGAVGMGINSGGNYGHLNYSDEE